MAFWVFATWVFFSIIWVVLDNSSNWDWYESALSQYVWHFVPTPTSSQEVPQKDNYLILKDFQASTVSKSGFYTFPLFNIMRLSSTLSLETFFTISYFGYLLPGVSPSFTTFNRCSNYFYLSAISLSFIIIIPFLSFILGMYV